MNDSEFRFVLVRKPARLYGALSPCCHAPSHKAVHNLSKIEICSECGTAWAYYGAGWVCVLATDKTPEWWKNVRPIKEAYPRDEEYMIRFAKWIIEQIRTGEVY